MLRGVGHDGVMALWTGLGDIAKEDSIYATLLDLEPGDEGPYETQLV